MANPRLALVLVTATLSLAGALTRAITRPRPTHASRSAPAAEVPDLAVEERRMCMALTTCTLGAISAEALADAADECVEAMEGSPGGTRDSAARADLGRELQAANAHCEHRCSNIVACYRSAMATAPMSLDDAEN